MKVYLGIDVGSVTTKLAALNENDEMVASLYTATEGKPVARVQSGLKQIKKDLPSGAEIKGVATTGSARYLAGAIVGADLVKNEITCQAMAAVHQTPEVRTIIEIGGQDSKIIIIREGMVADFGMNTVCAAGTGSFLDHQAARLNISIEEMSRMALSGNNAASITGRCTVFAESDMINKQQMGYSPEDIIYGLCRALVRNYLGDIASGKDIQTPVVFQGGVAFNQGMIKAFNEDLHTDMIVPPHPGIMGAIGAALLVHEFAGSGAETSRFRGFDISEARYKISSFACRGCPGACEITRISDGDHVIAHWGERCDKWTGNLIKQERNL
jgi:predicted CoA-substrate-specific enzyme activase